MITGCLSPATDARNPSTIPIIIGFLAILIHAFFIFDALSFSAALPSAFSGTALNVRTITENILNSGTAATIIRGAIPVLEYMLCMKAMPRIAALLRNDA